MDDFSKTVAHSPRINHRQEAYKRDMYQTQDQNEFKVLYAGKNGALTNKVLKAKPTYNAGDNTDILSDFGSEKSRSSSFYFGNGTSN